MTHEMTLALSYPTGGGLFVCPDCDRRVMIVPGEGSIDVVILDAGDLDVTHTGGYETVDWLEPWREWVEKRGL